MTGASSARAAGVARRRRRLSPTISPTDRAPTAASSRRRSSAIAVKKRTTSSGVPANLARRSSRWVAMPGRTGVEVALAGHVAADRDERRRPERELLGAEERGDEQVAPGLEAAVGAQRDPVAQVVAQQDLVDLGQAELPRRPDVLDRRQRRGAGPAGVAGQVDVRGARPWRRPRRSSRPRGSATSLTPIRAPRVDRAQVGDELGEVLDRVDVVVRRRADVALAGLAAAEGGDVGRRLAPGELAALAGLRALGDLDLELVGAGEVRGGHPEPCRGDLLDPRVVAAAVRSRDVPGRVLAALAGVGGAAGPLDPDRQRLVGLRAERADAHRRDDEAPDDRPGVLDLGERRAASAAVGSRSSSRGTARSAGGPGERGAVAGEGRVDVDGRRAATPPSAPPTGEQRDLAGDLRREEMRLAVGPEPREARDRAAAARGRRPVRGWPGPPRGGGSAGRRGRRASSGRATRRRSGSSGRRPTRRGRRRRSAPRRCTTRRR